MEAHRIFTTMEVADNLWRVPPSLLVTRHRPETGLDPVRHRVLGRGHPAATGKRWGDE
ncbi:hypothetical protein [Corynebacterium sp. A21]|uniref:hypothetical protein n=1 Tax=Corynebacterium sp. A21 TaxID=3457318 RepID=UPI003FD617F9